MGIIDSEIDVDAHNSIAMYTVAQFWRAVKPSTPSRFVTRSPLIMRGDRLPQRQMSLRLSDESLTELGESLRLSGECLRLSGKSLTELN